MFAPPTPDLQAHCDAVVAAAERVKHVRVGDEVTIVDRARSWCVVVKCVKRGWIEMECRTSDGYRGRLAQGYFECHGKTVRVSHIFRGDVSFELCFARTFWKE